jgi:hypothetical protein
MVLSITLPRLLLAEMESKSSSSYPAELSIMSRCLAPLTCIAFRDEDAFDPLPLMLTSSKVSEEYETSGSSLDFYPLNLVGPTDIELESPLLSISTSGLFFAAPVGDLSWSAFLSAYAFFHSYIFLAASICLYCSFSISSIALSFSSTPSPNSTTLDGLGDPLA